MADLAFFDEEFGEFDFPLTHAEDVAAVADSGQEHPDWKEFLRTFPSRKAYSDRVNHFILWQNQIIDNSDLLARLKVYFQVHHDMLKENGSAFYAPTCFRTWFSIFLKFWNFTGKGNLKSLAPLLYSNLTVWETGYEEAHAEPFTRY